MCGDMCELFSTCQPEMFNGEYDDVADCVLRCRQSLSARRDNLSRECWDATFELYVCASEAVCEEVPRNPINFPFDVTSCGEEAASAACQ